MVHPYRNRVWEANPQTMMKIPGNQLTNSLVGDLVFDLAGQRVWKGEHELRLTQREFDVLHYLARHAGRLVSTNEILDEVWGVEADVGDVALRTVIKRLRRKLGDDPKQPRYIVTIWGRGYRMDV